jgi:hypothetical protein
MLTIKFFKKKLTLPLFVTEVLADHHDATVTTNNFALVTNLLNAWLDLHVPPSFLYFLLVPINNATSVEVIWT